MKNLFIAIVLLISGNTFAQTSAITQLFDKYQKTEGITSIKIAKPMFDLINSLNIEDEDMQKIKPLISKINSLRIVILEKSENSANAFHSLRDDIKAALVGLNYEELIDISSDGETIKLLSQNSTNKTLNNMILSITGTDEVVFMVLEGDVSMEDVNKMITNEK